MNWCPARFGTCIYFSPNRLIEPTFGENRISPRWFCTRTVGTFPSCIFPHISFPMQCYYSWSSSHFEPLDLLGCIFHHKLSTTLCRRSIDPTFVRFSDENRGERRGENHGASIMELLTRITQYNIRLFKTSLYYTIVFEFHVRKLTAATIRTHTVCIR